METTYDISANRGLGAFEVHMRSQIAYEFGGSHIFAVLIHINYHNDNAHLTLEDFSLLMHRAVEERNKLISHQNGLHNPQLHMAPLSQALLTQLFLSHLAIGLG